MCALGALRPGRLTRVRDTTPASVVGPFERCSDTLLTLGYYPGQIASGYTVRTALIRRLWVRGDQARIGLISGAALGALAGGAFAAAKTDLCFQGASGVASNCHGNVARDAAVVGAIGGLIGYVLGRGFPRWAKIFP